METFKQVMAFPLFATVVWLAWVLGAQAGNDAVLALLGGLLVIGIGRLDLRPLGALGRVRAPRLRGCVSRPPACGSPGRAPNATPAKRAPRAPGPARSTGSRGRRRSCAELPRPATPVFVDFTAAWCVTCQVNKRVALNREEVVKAFADRGVVALKADWTNHDPRITATLAALGPQRPSRLRRSTRRGRRSRSCCPRCSPPPSCVDEISKLPVAQAGRGRRSDAALKSRRPA